MTGFTGRGVETNSPQGRQGEAQLCLSPSETPLDSEDRPYYISP